MPDGVATRSVGIAALLLAACSPLPAARLEDGGPAGGTAADGPVALPDGGLPPDRAPPPGDAAVDGRSGQDAPGAGGVTEGGVSGWQGPPVVIAVGNDGRHAVSGDGIEWTDDVREAMGNRPCGPRSLRAAQYANGTVVAVGGGCNPDCEGRIVTFDGITWSEATLPPGQGRLDGVAHGKGVWVAVGAAGLVLRSADQGRSWVAAGGGAIPPGLRALAFGAVGGVEMFVAVGDGNTRLRSADGSTWTDLQPRGGDGEGLRAVAIGNGVVVAVGGNGSNGRRIRSADGVAWIDEILGGPELVSVVFANDRFLVFSGSGDNTLHVSADGKSWITQVTVNAGASVAAGLLGGARLFVSRIAPSTIRTSPDGITWTTRVSSMQGDATINAFTFAGDQ
jgi:hypothetical protein